MKQNLGIPFFISFLLHGAVFITLSFKFNQSSYIIMPVELSFYSSSGGQAASAAPAPAESKGGSTGAGTGMETGPGSPISVGSARFPYSYYTNLVARKIEKNWQWANAFGRMKAVVFFRILRDGSITALAIKTSSGDDTFDQQALRSVELAGPFPPLPSGYSEDELGIYFEFAF